MFKLRTWLFNKIFKRYRLSEDPLLDIMSFKTVGAVKVTTLQDQKILHISLSYGNTKRIFRRPEDELMVNTVSRMICSMGQQKKKKKKSKLDRLHNIFDPEKADLVIALLDERKQEISQSQESINVWKKAHYFSINDDFYTVLFNPPSITKLTLSTMPMVKIPMFPVLQFSMAYPNYSLFTWYRSVEKYKEKKDEEIMDCTNANGESRKRSRADEAGDSMEISEDHLAWEEISKEKAYIPSAEDIGHVIKLEILPGNEMHPSSVSKDGIEMVGARSGVVCEGPHTCIFDKRHLLTKEHCTDPDKFRMITYNILADCYANTEFALSSLFPYCPQSIMDVNYRMQLVQKEILGYHGDIVCLQEVDRFVFEDILAPVMSFNNYAAAFANKNNTKEGVALFYNRAKFKLISVENKVLQQSLTKDDANSSLHGFVKSNTKLWSRVSSLGTCVLLSVLQSMDNPSRYLVVANTHLYYHPRAANIRLVQILIIVNLLKQKLELLRDSLDNDCTVSYLLCGDFNSKPHTALVEFMLNGHLPFNHADWYSGGIEEFHSSTTSFFHDFHLSSACEFPAYTNYAAGFNECLDYIFIDNQKLKVDRVVDAPDHESVVQHTALPCVTAPSDHIAQVVDLNWK